MANITPYSDSTIILNDVSLILTAMLFVFLSFEVFKIYPEKSQSTIILEYKFEKMKEKGFEENIEEEEEKKEKKEDKQRFWVWPIKVCQKIYFFVIIFPSIPWFASKFH